MLTQRLRQTDPATGFRGLLALVFAIALASVLPGCVSTQIRTATDTAGVPLHVTGSVVLVEPDIELSELLAGGVQEPRQAWSEAARQHYPQAAREVLQAQGITVRPDFNLPADAGPDNRLRQLYLLNQAVSLSILQHARAGSRLRNKHGRFDWTLGPGVADLRAATGADYALFTYLRDSYSSSGRVAMRIIGFVLLGGDVGGGTQVGLASLVDLRTGQVIWHNLLLDQTGDVRDLQGARETAGDLLQGIHR